MTKDNKKFDPFKAMDEMTMSLHKMMRMNSLDPETAIKAYSAARQWVSDRHKIMMDLNEANPPEGGVDAYSKELEAKGGSVGNGNGNRATSTIIAGLPESIAARISGNPATNTSEKGRECGDDGDVQPDDEGDRERTSTIGVGLVVPDGGLYFGDDDGERSNTH